MSAHAETAAAEPEVAEPFDLAARELCPDGSCIGVLGSDRRCKVCGELSPVSQRSPDAVVDGDLEDPDRGPDDDLGDGSFCTETDQDFLRRRLCADGSCIGVLDEDGRCKVCGHTDAPPCADQLDTQPAGS